MMSQRIDAAIADLLEEKFEQFNHPDFIEDDPISIPHQFTKKQDIEIAGFWVAMLAWGQRKTIIQKGQMLMHLMGNSPHDFIKNHSENERKKFLNFKHRTFNTTDTLYFLEFLQQHYRQYDSLESAFTEGGVSDMPTVEIALTRFHHYFFSLPDAPIRTRKHIATPQRKSACKRLNMFLRWMVRRDKAGVDFGIWHALRPEQLVCPLDLHVERVAKKLRLLTRKPTDWQAATELTDALRTLDPVDPVKYDYALFGLGLEGFAT